MPRLIRVDLASPHNASSLDLEPSPPAPEDASDCPPAVDSSGNVYVSARSSQSNASGGRVVSANGSLATNWTHVFMTSGSTGSTNLPVGQYRFALQDGGSLYVSGHWTDLNTDPTGNLVKQRVAKLTSSTGALTSWLDRTWAAGEIGPQDYPVLSWDASAFYDSRVVNTMGSAQIYLTERSTSSLGQLNEVSLDSTTSFTRACTAVAIFSGGDVLAPGGFSTVRQLSSGLIQNNSWTVGSNNGPSIDGSGNAFIVGTNGSVNVIRNDVGRTVLTVTASASGEVAIRSSTTAVVRNNGGLSLLVGN